MEIGVSTACLYPQETERALEALLDLGVRQFEFFFNSACELRTPYLRELVRRLDAFGARAVSLHPYSSVIESTLFFSAYRRRFRDGLELYRPYFEAAAQLGAPLIVLHGDRGQALPEAEMFERFAGIAEEAKRFGVMPAQENVRGHRCASAAVIGRMRAALGKDAAFVLDLKQAHIAGEDPLAVCRAMGDALRHIHFNDFTDRAPCLLPGRGSADYPALFRALRDQRFAGTGVVEVYRESFGTLQELTRSVQFVNRFCQDR